MRSLGRLALTKTYSVVICLVYSRSETLVVSKLQDDETALQDDLELLSKIYPRAQPILQ
jgi:hypothetical protein